MERTVNVNYLKRKILVLQELNKWWYESSYFFAYSSHRFGL